MSKERPDETMGVLAEATQVHNKLVYRQNTECQIQSQMLDLDSPEGKVNAQNWLNAMAKLIPDLSAELQSRVYRMNYSHSYR